MLITDTTRSQVLHTITKKANQIKIKCFLFNGLWHLESKSTLLAWHKIRIYFCAECEKTFSAKFIPTASQKITQKVVLDLKRNLFLFSAKFPGFWPQFPILTWLIYLFLSGRLSWNKVRTRISHVAPNSLFLP